MFFRIKKIIFIFLSFFLLASSAQAKNLGDAFGSMLGNFGQNAGYNIETDTPETIVSIVIKVVLSLLGVVFLSLMVYGGYLWMTAAGNDEKLKKAQNLITAAVIGMIIVISSYAISSFVLSNLEDTTLLDTSTEEGE